MLHHLRLLIFALAISFAGKPALAHGPTVPPDPWNVRVAHGPTVPPDPWNVTKGEVIAC